MDSAVSPRIDRGIVVVLVVVCAVLAAFVASSAFARTARMVVESAWLYLTNTRG